MSHYNPSDGKSYPASRRRSRNPGHPFRRACAPAEQEREVVKQNVAFVERGERFAVDLRKVSDLAVISVGIPVKSVDAQPRNQISRPQWRRISRRGLGRVFVRGALILYVLHWKGSTQLIQGRRRNMSRRRQAGQAFARENSSAERLRFDDILIAPLRFAGFVASLRGRLIQPTP